MTTDPGEGRMRLTLIGGFLGAGKSTWLRHQLHHGAFRDALVIVNEAADVSVDGTLLHAPRMRMLPGGCACCERRDALIALLRAICDERVAASARGGERVGQIVLETSGLADPARILAACAADPVLQHHLVAGETIVMIDALHGLGQIREEELGRRQAETADRLIVTKVDAAESGALRRLVAALRALGPGADLAGAAMGAPAALPNAADDAPEPLSPPIGGAPPIAAVSIALAGLDWPTLAIWLSALIHAHGDRILRIKGVIGAPRGRLLFQSVRKVVQRPEILPDEAGETPDDRLVLIGRGLDADTLRASLSSFRALGGTGARAAG